MFHENLVIGATLFHADGQTKMTKLIVAFHNFVKEPTNKNAYNITTLSILFCTSRFNF
jgi:hypothetical protein